MCKYQIKGSLSEYRFLISETLARATLCQDRPRNDEDDRGESLFRSHFVLLGVKYLLLAELGAVGRVIWVAKDVQKHYNTCRVRLSYE